MCPQSVEELLQQLGATGDETVTRPSWHYQEQQQQQPDSNSSSMSLRHALTVAYDIKTPKAKPLLQLLLDQLTAAAASDDSSKLDQQQQQNGSSPLRPSIDLQVDATGGKPSPASKPAAAAGKQAAAASPAAAAIAAIQGLLASDASSLDAYLTPRHVIDVLQDFPAARLKHTQVCRGGGVGSLCMPGS